MTNLKTGKHDIDLKWFITLSLKCLIDKTVKLRYKVTLKG